MQMQFIFGIAQALSSLTKVLPRKFRVRGEIIASKYAFPNSA
jgi:hypothetical protein